MSLTLLEVPTGDNPRLFFPDFSSQPAMHLWGRANHISGRADDGVDGVLCHMRIDAFGCEGGAGGLLAALIHRTWWPTLFRVADWAVRHMAVKKTEGTSCFWPPFSLSPQSMKERRGRIAECPSTCIFKPGRESHIKSAQKRAPLNYAY